MAAKSVAKSAKATKAKSAPKEKRAPSAYNVFIKAEVAKVRKDQPDLKPAEAFKVAAEKWATSPQNPKNKK